MEDFHRNNFIMIIDKTLSSFLKSILPLAIMFFSKNLQSINVFQKLLIMLGIFLLIVIYQVIKWYKNLYCIHDNVIMIKEGIIFIKRKEIPFNKIQTVDISQGIKHRIFGLAQVKVDTGNSSLKKEELSFLLKKIEAENLKENIFNTNNRNTQTLSSDEVKVENEESYKTDKHIVQAKEFKVSTRELILSAITSNAVFTGVLFLASAFPFIDDYLKDFLDNTFSKASFFIENINFDEMSVGSIVLWIILILVICIVVSLIIAIITTIIKFHGFSVKRENDNLIINYGLLEKKNYIMPIKKISAIYLKQNIIKQMFKFRAIHIETVGYGNEKGESSILYPLTIGSKYSELIQGLLPEYKFDEMMTKVPKRALGRFLSMKFIVTFIISIVLTINFKYGYICFLSVPFFTLLGYLQYKNSAIGKSSDLLCISNNSFTKVTSIIPINKIQSIVTENNYFQKRKMLFNLEVSIQGNNLGTAIKIKNLSLELRDELELLLT
ncbi:PH domain-containing protein [Clostridium vincentii]|uniref:Bacterial membrane flanked domain protein n=1 Tax=Clostridium vincentii TaxID=52704 RepID=A0A2T0BFL7_9CLOT|nr:PH domain-containing protein [Clostridium vincentii]PRR82623.1 Bacterial membrane flanked domain protein [Clostridium vincentii]